MDKKFTFAEAEYVNTLIPIFFVLVLILLYLSYTRKEEFSNPLS